jgi:hypothetical protein
MRLRRAMTLTEIARQSRVSADEVRRFNPALKRRVPAGATLYLPKHVAAFGPDVSFWHRPPSRAYSEALSDFLQLDVPLDEWDSPSFDAVLQQFRQRFAATRTEEGTVMATTLGYVLQDRRTSGQAEILAEFRSSDRILRLFAAARAGRDAFRASSAAAPVTTD